MEAFRAAADAERAAARPLSENGFKVELTRRTIAAVLGELARPIREPRPPSSGLMGFRSPGYSPGEPGSRARVRTL